jgi:dephospho-CoA kinase
VKIAITGCLGTGKSTVSKLFSAYLGAEYIDTDDLCRQHLIPGGRALAQLTHIYGDKYLGADGSLNRPLLRQDVFAETQVKANLENILHPIVRQEVTTRFVSFDAKEKDFVVEVPLLFEVGWQDDFDCNIVVYVPNEVSFKRVAARDGFTVHQIQQVLSTQLPISQKRLQAQFIVDNSGTFVSTVHQVSWIITILNKQRQ